MQQVSAELVEWLQNEIGRGCRPEVLIESMIKAGYEADFARNVINASFASLEALEGKRPNVLGANLEGTLKINTDPLPGNFIKTSDRDVQVLLNMQSPRIMLFGGLLSDEECDGIIEFSRAKMARSHVVDSDAGGTREDSAVKLRCTRGSRSASASCWAGRWSTARACRSCTTTLAASTSRTTTTSTTTARARPNSSRPAASASPPW
jgi:hypothetical protein